MYSSPPPSPFTATLNPQSSPQMYRVFRASAAAMMAVKAAPAAKLSGIQMPFPVTASPPRFLGVAPEASRPEAMKKTWDFVRLNNLQNPADQRDLKKDFSIVHVLLKRKKKVFITVTDAMGNKKTGASTGSLGDRKGRSRVSRYAAEATAEHVGRSVRKMGIKSVVMKVKGYAFFRKKKKVILSWREAFLGEGVRTQREPPIKYIHDVTNLPHNGCRLPKRRRV